MTTDSERREVARRLREAASHYESMERDVDFYPVESALGLKPTGETTYTPESVRSLADLIEPSCDLGPSGWTSFDERSPEPGAPVLCKGKNGAYYVGKPVTLDGERTGKVWVPRGAEYRSPAAWRPVDYPPCDRAALLALADELGRVGYNDWLHSGEWEPEEIARRIRGALGVES